MKLDTKEFELPDTLYIRDIETGVFRSIAEQSLQNVEGIALEHLHVDVDPKGQTISLKIVLSVLFGVPIPQKAEEIQSLLAEQMTKLTGLHVASIHLVFKNIYFPGKEKPQGLYTDEF